MDHGPGIRIAKGEIERELRPDIASKAERKPDVRGARRRDGLMLMWRRGQLSDSQMAAAEAFRDDMAVAAGARMGLPGDGMAVRSRRRDYTPSSRQIDALTRCKAAWAAVGPIHQPIVSWVVVSWGTLGGYAMCRHMRPSRATEQMLKALDLLADFYTAHTTA